MHESLQVQCMMSLQSRDNVQALVVIRAHMSGSSIWIVPVKDAISIWNLKQ